MAVDQTRSHIRPFHQRTADADQVMSLPNDEQGLPFCNFCEQSYDPYDWHSCVGNSIGPRVRKPVEDEFSPPDPYSKANACDYQYHAAFQIDPFGNDIGLTRQQIGEALDAERALEMPLDKFAETTRVPGYESLEAVLFDAYLQAATGKGAARHGRGIRFDEQPTQAISRLLGTDAGLAFQAMKKINEGMRLDHAAKIKELLGAINYIASIIIHMEYDNGR